MTRAAVVKNSSICSPTSAPDVAAAGRLVPTQSAVVRNSGRVDGHGNLNRPKCRSVAGTPRLSFVNGKQRSVGTQYLRMKPHYLSCDQLRAERVGAS